MNICFRYFGWLMLLRKVENQVNKYDVIGIMSGTSLDGVDLAYCQFKKKENGWEFNICVATTVAYTDEWHTRLSSLHNKNAEEFAATHVDYGHYLGDLTKEFTQHHQLKIDFISSHGHTIFHRPHRRFTFQIGEGAALCAASGLPVVCDFRSKDVALGGQGAPLVPIGDELLFSSFDFCLNLGGIANISFKHNSERIAFDVSPCNLVLNYLAEEQGKKFDNEGNLARQGKVNEFLLSHLNDCSFYKSKSAGPKSLGREDVERDFLSVIHLQQISSEDKLRTFCEHIAFQISTVVNKSIGENSGKLKLLVTGGGAFNQFLVQRIESLSHVQVVVPEKKIVEYKEALIFAFLGVLRWRNEINCLKSVTGASINHVSGAIHIF